MVLHYCVLVRNQDYRFVLPLVVNRPGGDLCVGPVGSLRRNAMGKRFNQWYWMSITVAVFWMYFTIAQGFIAYGLSRLGYQTPKLTKIRAINRKKHTINYVETAGIPVLPFLLACHMPHDLRVMLFQSCSRHVRVTTLFHYAIDEEHHGCGILLKRGETGFRIYTVGQFVY